MKITFKSLAFTSLLSFIISCQTEKKTESKQTYLRFVGDIQGDSDLDKPEFNTCNGDERVFQYFNTGEGFRYKGEKTTLVSKIQKLYKPLQNLPNQSGYIRIRFIVNCKGEAGRFRVLASDFNYQEKEFDKAIIDQLLSIIERLDGWEIMTKSDKTLDYYLYLIFKIDNGHIIEILP